MALRCRLECSERGWAQHRAEVLERFDAERREWELQLRDMQHKVEEVSRSHAGGAGASRTGTCPDCTSVFYSQLCNEVKSHRDRPGMRSSPLRLSLQSSTAGSSVLSDSVSRNGSGGHPDGRCDSVTRHHDGRADAANRHSNSEWDAEIEEILQGCLHHKFEPSSPRRRAVSSPTPRARPTLSSYAPLTPLVCSNPSPSTRPPLSTFSPIVIQPISKPSPIVHQAFSSPSSYRQAFSSSSSSHQSFSSPSSSIQQNLKSLSSSHQTFSSPASSKHQAFSRPSPSNQPLCSPSSSIHQAFSGPSPSHQTFSGASSNIQQAFTSPSPNTQLANGSSSLTTPQSLTNSVCSTKVFGLPCENNKTKNITALNAVSSERIRKSPSLRFNSVSFVILFH